MLRGSRIAVCRGAVLLLAVVSASAWGQGVAQAESASSTPVVTQAQASAHDWETLKLSVLSQINLQASRRDDAQFPLRDRVNVYLGDLAASAAPLRILLSIDGGSAQEIELDADLISALGQSGSLRRVARFAVPQGTHRLRAELLAAGRTSAVVSEATFEKPEGALDLEWLLRADELQAWRAEDPAAAANSQRSLPLLQSFSSLFNSDPYRRYRPGAKTDPAVRHARHLAQLGQSDAAVAEWLSISAVSDPIGASSVLPPIDVADLYREAGLLRLAAALCDSLQAQAGEVPRSIMARTRLRLGEAFYEQGDAERAETQFRLAAKGLPERVDADRRLAYSQLLVRQNRMNEALSVLRQSNPDYVEAQRFLDDGVESLRSAALRRYNLGVMLVKSGKEREGLSWLDLVGRIRAGDDELLMALRDKANLALGWHFLEAQQGRTAIGVLGRVRQRGPYANTALVGMGWAQLVPSGEKWSRTSLENAGDEHRDLSASLPSSLNRSLKQLRVLEPEQHGEFGPLAFATEDPPKDRQEGLRRALQIWSMLTPEDGFDPAMQEAELARAYALDQLEDRDQAISAYDSAIARLRSEREALAAMAQRWRGEAPSLIASEAADGPQALLSRFGSSSAFGDLDPLLQQHRDAEALLKTLGRLGDEQAQELSQDIAARQEQITQQIGGMVVSALETRRKLVDDYLRAAYLSAARFQDPGVHPAGRGEAGAAMIQVGK